MTKQPTDITETGHNVDEARTLRPPVDVVDMDGTFLVTLDLPGVALNDVEVAFDRREMTIAATSRHKMPEGTRVLRREFDGRVWRRTFTVGEDIDTENASATLVDGVLQVRLPKTTVSKTRRVPVTTTTNH